MFMQTRFDTSLWLPRPGESLFDYWASLSPMAPFFGISWRFAEADTLDELGSPEPAVPSRIDAAAEDAEIVAEPAPVAVPTPVAAPAAFDDLTEIKGVGPKMAQRLSEHGITSFAQIAEWSTQTVAEMNEKLGCLPGMIERADWVRQARELADYVEAKRA